MIAGIALAAGVLVGVLAAGGGDKKKESAGTVEKNVQLEPVSSSGSNPFMASVGTDEGDVEPPAEVASASSPQNYAGSLPGLYGGTRDVASCDPDKMVDFLQANPDKAAAWAGVLGIRTSDIAQYVSELTPVILRADTAVTNHGFVNGRANSIPAILQAGTAVLIDKYGTPRVKCYCGNPLTPPRYPAEPTYIGDPWPTFKPGGVVIIDNSTTVINVITIIDIQTNEPFGRPIGTDGTEDTDAPTDNSSPLERPGSEKEAVEYIKRELTACITSESAQNQGDDFNLTFTPEEAQQLVDSLQYESTENNGLVTVKVTGDQGDFATWEVNIDTGEITAADQTASEVGADCPNLA